MATVREEINQMREMLRPLYGKEEAEAMIRLIFYNLKEWSAVDLFMNEEKEVSPYIHEKIADILERLKRHEPLQYILGEARFYGMDLKVNRSVLIPRVETEQLVDMIVKDADERSDIDILDIGTGSGCIAVALARNLRFPHIVSLDISGEALEVARANAKDKGVSLTFIQGDVFDWYADPESLDIVVSNPPYIHPDEKRDMEPNVLEYEPARALFVNPEDPIAIYRRIIELASVALRPGGKIYLEINPNYAEAMVAEAHDFHLVDVQLHRDIYGRQRFLTAQR